jgi:hypothetical protein
MPRQPSEGGDSPKQPKVQEGYHCNVRGAKYEDSPVYKRATKGTSEQFVGNRMSGQPIKRHDSPVNIMTAHCTPGMSNVGQDNVS